MEFQFDKFLKLNCLFASFLVVGKLFFNISYTYQMSVVLYGKPGQIKQFLLHAHLHSVRLGWQYLEDRASDVINGLNILKLTGKQLVLSPACQHLFQWSRFWTGIQITSSLLMWYFLFIKDLRKIIDFQILAVFENIYVSKLW